METRATYKRVSRRYEGNPGNKRSVGLDVLIALDESGSITDEQLQTFYVELMAVNRITNARILVTEFDTACTPPKPASEYRHVKRSARRTAEPTSGRFLRWRTASGFRWSSCLPTARGARPSG